MPIVGGLESLAFAVDRYRIKKIAIGTTKLSSDALATIHAFAEGMGIEVVEIGFGVRWMTLRAKAPHVERSTAAESRTA